MSCRSVQEYVEMLNEDGKNYVNLFLKFMENEYPQFPVKISYSIPMWWKGKKMQEGYVGISAAKNHVSVHFSDENFVTVLHERLPGCKRGKRCINICYNDNASFQRILDAVNEFFR